MNHKLLLAAALCLGTSACAGTAPGSAKSAAAAEPSGEQHAKKASKKRQKGGAAEGEASEATARLERKVGDYSIHRFSGSFTEEPLVLTEQVIAMEGDVLVVDFVLEQGAAMESLRVRMRGGVGGEILKVSRVAGEVEEPVDRTVFDAMIAKTLFAPDSNDERLSSEATTCLAGTREVSCTMTTYSVAIGDDDALLTVTRSADLPGRDLGGEIIAGDGTTLYRAKLIDVGNDAPVSENLALRSDSSVYRPSGI